MSQPQTAVSLSFVSFQLFLCVFLKLYCAAFHAGINHEQGSKFSAELKVIEVLECECMHWEREG